MAIPNKIIKILYAKSGNICAFPQCTNPLSTGINHSEIAHIVSPKKNGPRHIDGYNGGNYDVEENLILLCPIHHHQIDTSPEDYPIDLLQDIKKAHEEYVSRSLQPLNPTQEFVNDFLKICQDNQINELLYDLNIGASFNDQLLYYSDACYAALKPLLNSPQTVEVDKKIFTELSQFAETLENMYSNVAICCQTISIDSNIATFLPNIPNENLCILREQQKWLQNTYSKYRFVTT
ncbi:MAG: HNH endonuclease [Ruminococcaceae bacterium]|nr:HNH endonuclease [Oscillospiraceae bacterium]